MLKKIPVVVLSGLLMLNIYGCVALFAGAAGGAGTAAWLSGKLTEQFNSPYERTVTAAKKALDSLDLPVTKQTQEEQVTQIRSKYKDGREIWIDIRKITENSTKVEVRVGAVHADKEAAALILKRIQSYL